MARGWGGNMDNYALINGKRVELTDEQVKALGIEERKNPFERVERHGKYYRITAANCIDDYVENFDSTDDRLYDVANYFNDEAFAKQVALHQQLYRKLLKFAYDNGCEDAAEWDGENMHYHVYYSHVHKTFKIELNYEGHHPGVYFSSSDGALQAIEEVVKPFIKEHPDFVW